MLSGSKKLFSAKLSRTNDNALSLQRVVGRAQHDDDRAVTVQVTKTAEQNYLFHRML